MKHRSASIHRRDFLARTGMGIAVSTAGLRALAQDQRAAGANDIMVTDFERSCLRFRMDTTKKVPKTVSRKLPMTLNNVRFNLDARVVIRHKASGRVHDYVLTSSCKSEQVWMKRDVWHQPNADMCMMAGPDEFLIFKRWDKADKGVMLYPPSLGAQPERQLGDPKDAFDTFSINLVKRPGRVLGDVDAILATLASATPVLAHTEYEAAGHEVLLEYPVRCVNFSERERYYQVDTGPVLLPDFARDFKSPLEGCRLAYIAHNCPDWAELIVCVPTPLTDSIKVHHYSESIRIEPTRNRLIALA
jgi:hypothetical protein